MIDTAIIEHPTREQAAFVATHELHRLVVVVVVVVIVFLFPSFWCDSRSPWSVHPFAFSQSSHHALIIKIVLSVCLSLCVLDVSAGLVGPSVARSESTFF